METDHGGYEQGYKQVNKVPPLVNVSLYTGIFPR